MYNILMILIFYYLIMYIIDGDILNNLALTMEEFWEIFEGFSPVNMLIDRTNSSIRYDVSGLENITLAILSDK